MMKELVGNKKTFIITYLIFSIFLLIIPLIIRGYNLLVVNLILVYVIVSVGYNLVLGYAGQFSLAQAAFFGIGAYSSGIMIVTLGIPFWISMPLAGIIASIVGILIGVPSLRLGGIYLAMLTYAFAEFIIWIFIHWEKLTKGVYGLSVPSPHLGSFVFSTDTRVYFLALIVTILMVIVAKNIINSKIGRAFTALRDSEVAAHAMGVNIVVYKVIAFALSAFYAGIAGSLFNVVILFVHPDAFGLIELIREMSMVIIGGLGSIWGSIMGVVIMVLVAEVLREFKSLQEIIYGFSLLVFIIFMPEGIRGLVQNVWDWFKYKKN